MTLPISKTYPPMEAAPAASLPLGPQWQYEPKWDGFRCLTFRDKKKIDLQSKSGKPLPRYFPELVAALSRLRATQFVLDGEIVIPVDGDLSFDQLLMRIHPSAARVEKLSRQTLGGNCQADEQRCRNCVAFTPHMSVMRRNKDTTTHLINPVSWLDGVGLGRPYKMLPSE